GHTAATDLVVDTRAGLKHLSLDVDPSTSEVRTVTVDMGTPTLERGKVPMTGGEPAERFTREPFYVHGRKWTRCAVPTGTPHLVLFLEDGDDLGRMDVPGIGSTIEHLPAFPNRTNVEFVVIEDPSRLRIRIWERGVGETMACGTGACAALV